MHFKRIAVITALSLAASGAFAANLGLLDLSSGSAGFANTPIAGPFLDTYSFSVLNSVVANGSVTSVVNGLQNVDFTSIVVAGPAGTFSFSEVLGDPIEVWALPPGGVTLTPGIYSLSLAGTNSAAIGSYGGNFAVSIMPAVPEPESYALLLAGLGAIGVLAGYRRAS